MNQAYYETTAFFLTSQLHYLMSYLNVVQRSKNDRDVYSHRLIFFHGRSIFLENVIFSTKPTHCLLEFLTFLLILSTGDCHVDISATLIPGKGLVIKYRREWAGKIEFLADTVLVAHPFKLTQKV